MPFRKALSLFIMAAANSGVHAATDEAIQPDNSYRMSGNQISVKTLDLNRDFSEISAQLDAIVDEHFS